MACKMRFSTAFVVLLAYVVLAREEVRAKSSASPTLSYWHRKLPTTPIPDGLRELMSPLSSQKTSELLDAMREGKKVSLGEPAPTPKPDLESNCIVKTTYILKNNYTIAEPSLSAMFFLEEDLHSGAKMTLYSGLFKRSSPESRIFFLPRRLAEAIPFSSDKLSAALEKLDISQGSNTALAMKQTLQLCESPADSHEERRYCTTSLESMIDYATATLGTSRVIALETNVPKIVSRNYTITGISSRSNSGSKSVVCHSLTYAYAVYYCHEIKDTITARVSLKGEDGTSGEGVAVCHRDTTWWSPQHVAFKVLNVKPGGAPICHFMADDNVVWLAAN